MTDERLTALSEEIRRIYDEEARLPFPYEGCRTLLQDISNDFEGFIPDLDMYFSDIAGYSCSTKKFSEWSAPSLRETIGHLSLNFFERHPEYVVLQRLIGESTTPDLHEDLLLYDQLRQKLLALLSGLLSLQEPDTT